MTRRFAPSFLGAAVVVAIVIAVDRLLLNRIGLGDLAQAAIMAGLGAAIYWIATSALTEWRDLGGPH